MRVFVSGGARSGKSAYAEALVRRFHQQHLYEQHSHGRHVYEQHVYEKQPGKRYYLAAAEASDQEMVQRIARHRQDRGDGWITLEAPVDLLEALTEIEPGSSVLLDCLTLWASQVGYASPSSADSLSDASFSKESALAMLTSFLEEAQARRLNLVMVSNDTNEGIPIDDQGVQDYQRLLERMHRLVIAHCECAVQVVAGIPIYWKERQSEGIYWKRHP